MYIWGNTEVLSRNHCYGGKTIDITYSECMSWALVTIIHVRFQLNLNFVDGSMYIWGNTEVRSRNHCYGGKAIDITYSECMSLALVPKIHVRFKWNLNFVDGFSKQLSNIRFRENACSGSRVVAELFHADKRTNILDEVPFGNFANAPKNEKYLSG